MGEPVVPGNLSGHHQLLETTIQEVDDRISSTRVEAALLDTWNRWYTRTFALSPSKAEVEVSSEIQMTLVMLEMVRESKGVLSHLQSIKSSDSNGEQAIAHVDLILHRIEAITEQLAVHFFCGIPVLPSTTENRFSTSRAHVIANLAELLILVRHTRSQFHIVPTTEDINDSDGYLHYPDAWIEILNKNSISAILVKALYVEASTLPVFDLSQPVFVFTIPALGLIPTACVCAALKKLAIPYVLQVVHVGPRSAVLARDAVAPLSGSLMALVDDLISQGVTFNSANRVLLENLGIRLPFYNPAADRQDPKIGAYGGYSIAPQSSEI